MSVYDQPPAGPGAKDSSNRHLGQILAVIGAGGALVGWIALVGAVREYARFRSAGIPSPAETAALFPHDALIGEGLSALAPVLLIGLGLGLVTYGVTAVIPSWRMRVRQERWTERERDLDQKRAVLTDTNPNVPESTEAERRFDEQAQQFEWDRARLKQERDMYETGVPSYVKRFILALTAALILVGAILLGVFYTFVWGEAVLGVFLLVGLLGLLLLWETFGSPAAAAITVFTVIAVYGGIGEFWHQLDEPSPKFDSVVVYRHGLPTVAGFYVTRSGGNVYVAVLPEIRGNNGNKFAVLSVPDRQVELVIIGPEYRLTNGAVELEKHQEQPEASRTPTPGGPPAQPPVEPAPTVPPKPVTPRQAVTTPSPSPTPTVPPKPIPPNQPVTTPSPGPTPPKPPAPVIHVFALDELVPNRNYFCVPVGTGRLAETLALRFMGQYPKQDSAQFEVAPPQSIALRPGAKEWVPVPLSPTVSDRLRVERTLSVDVAITANPPGSTVSTEYTVELEAPGGETGHPPCGP
jgi:hypothetical protein